MKFESNTEVAVVAYMIDRSLVDPQEPTLPFVSQADWKASVRCARAVKLKTIECTGNLYKFSIPLVPSSLSISLLH